MRSGMTGEASSYRTISGTVSLGYTCLFDLTNGLAVCESDLPRPDRMVCHTRLLRPNLPILTLHHMVPMHHLDTIKSEYADENFEVSWTAGTVVFAFAEYRRDGCVCIEGSEMLTPCTRLSQSYSSPLFYSASSFSSPDRLV